MRFSTRTRYGLRFLIRLSLLPAAKRVQLSQVAEEENISAGYLEQIVRVLKPSGILDAARGSGGGYCLAKAAEDINMEDVFTYLEGEIYPVGCLSPAQNCEREDICSSRDFWRRLDICIRDFLKSWTLAQIRDLCQAEEAEVKNMNKPSSKHD